MELAYLYSYLKLKKWHTNELNSDPLQVLLAATVASKVMCGPERSKTLDSKIVEQSGDLAMKCYLNEKKTMIKEIETVNLGMINTAFEVFNKTI